MRSQGGLGYSPGISSGGAPAAHASTHASGGSDPIAPDDFGAMSAALADLTGGEAGSLDGLATAGGAIAENSVRFVVQNFVLSSWKLTDDDSAENVAGGIIRPDDYATTTNEFVWLQVS